jgi:hypothetical protein
MRLPDDIEQKLLDGKRLRETAIDLAQRLGISLGEARQLIKHWFFEREQARGGGTDDS